MTCIDAADLPAHVTVPTIQMEACKGNFDTAAKSCTSQPNRNLSQHGRNLMHTEKTYVDVSIAALVWLALPAMVIAALSLTHSSFSYAQLLVALLIALAKASFDYLNMSPGEMDSVQKAHCVEMEPYLAQPKGLPITEEPTIAFCTKPIK